MQSIRFPQIIIVLGITVLLAACVRVPYGDQLPVTPQIPKENDVAELPVSATDCPLLNTDPADTTVTYTNPEKKISFAIPYNEHWGPASFPMPAYVDHPGDDTFPMGYTMFGPPTANFGPDPGDCTPSYSYEMTTLPARTAAAAEKAIRDGRTEVVPNTTVKTINGLTVVRYTDAGLCNYPTLEVIGTAYNYSFTTNCGGDEKDQWQYLESAVKSISLLP